jgi:hypothetical protein
MSNIVKYVSSALARGIHQNAFAASCDDTQMPAGPDRSPQLRKDLKKEPDPTATLPAPGGAANMTAPGGASSSPIRSRSDKVAEPDDLNKDPEPSSTLSAPWGGGELGLGHGHGHGLDRGSSTGHAARFSTS